MNPLAIIFNLAAVLIWLFILYYITNLEITGCKCALDWRRNFIQYYIIYLLIMMLFSTRNLPPYILTLHFVFSVCFILIVHHYINDLKTKKCKCSESTVRDVLMYVNYIQLYMVIFILILLVHLMFEFNAFIRTKSPENLKACLKKIN